MPARMKWRRHGLSTFASDFVVQRPTPPLWHIDAVGGRPPHQYTIPFRRTGQSRRLRHLSLTRMMVLKHGTYIPSPHSGRPRRCTAETATYSAEATWHPQEIFWEGKDDEPKRTSRHRDRRRPRHRPGGRLAVG